MLKCLKTASALFLLGSFHFSSLSAQDLLHYVDPFIGTAPASTESARKHSEAGSELKGQTFPAIGRPFGMTQWTPETRTTETKCIAPYYYNDKLITGIRASHWMSGSCTQDYGSFSLMPFVTRNIDTVTNWPSSKYNHTAEVATPAFYSLMLDDFDVKVELTANVRSGFLRITFPRGSGHFVAIRSNSDEKEGKIWFDQEHNEIVGYNPAHRIYQGWGKPAGFSGWFVVKFNKPFRGIPQKNNPMVQWVDVGRETNLLVRVGTSFTSLEAARANMEKELPDWDFEKPKKESETVWNQTLGKISVAGGSEEDKIKFYTALYHSYQLPRIASDADGSYPGFAQDTTLHKAVGFDYYDDFSMWDTYRALHPLMTILEPERSLHMIKSLVAKAQQGGWMPIFPAWGNYTAAMIGDHVSTMISDAYIKGIRGFNTDTAYFYMRKNAFNTPSVEEYKDGKGRRALESYLKYGYIPLEDSVWEAFHKREQVSRTLEYALDDFALSQFAKAIGKKADADILWKRSQNYRNVFDPETRFVRGRHADGSWVSPFNPISKASYICEGTPYQYTWYVPQDVPGLIDLMGGKEAFLNKLGEFFEQGYYWHGNEPDHQAAYMFAMAGAPEKTYSWVKKIVNDEYGTGPGGVSGNDDAGQMSAWLVCSMMGFYPVCPGTDQYVLSCPIFDKIRIQLPGKKAFTAEVVNRSGTKSRFTVTKNDKPYSSATLLQNDILTGSKLRFDFY